MMMGRTLGTQAVVIGAGMGGLAAAGALAGHFDRIVVLERDLLPQTAMHRPGTPQDRHLHGLLPGGQRALSTLFPKFEEDLIAAGALPLSIALDLRSEVPGLGPLPRRDFGRLIYVGSRPLIEFTVRQQVERLTNVTIRSGCRVREITTARDGAAVTGVRYESDGGQQQSLSADLVVDASGRGAPTLELLRSTGRALPPETVIGIDFHYCTARFTIPADAPSEWRAVVTPAKAPERRRGGGIAPIEGNAWLVTLGGRLGDRPPTDWDGFMAYAQQLETPTVYEAIKHAERQGDIVHFGFPASVWRHFERLDDLPRGLVPLGDAICRFNPIYGQGMSVAALEAGVLHQLLGELAAQQGADPLAELGAAFLSRIQPLIEAPWNMSAIPDLVYPETQGERPADFENRLKFGGALARLAMRNPDVHRLMLEVQHLLKPPSVYDDPAIQQLVQAELATMAAA
jgi:2-polyprenyl-6-methoxyphenol hydroxylase-like FAD-dependent oxidoreductase